MAAAAVACPLRRSTRLAHAHPRPRRRPKPQPPAPHRDADDHDSSSSDPENELTPRALRALKRQRLALDPDGLPLPLPARTKRRRKDHRPPCPPMPPPIPQPATPSPPLPDDLGLARLDLAVPPTHPEPPSPSTSAEPLTPLTPLTPSPESSPSLPGHDRQPPPLPSPPHDPLPPPICLPDPPTENPLPSDPFPPLPPPGPISLDSALNTLIPFEGLHPQFDPDLSVQIPPPSCQPSPPQLQGLELQDHFHSFQQQQLYVPPNPVFVRDREINIWKLACQERVDCLLRRYGIDYIKALVESQARSLSQGRSTSTPGPSTPQSGPAQTKFRLYTPASYTYTSTSWGSSSGTRKPSPIDEENEDLDAAWSMDDADWVDTDVDMEDEDEDDYDEDDEAADAEPHRDGEATVDGLVVPDPPPKLDPVAMQVDDNKVDAVPVEPPKPTATTEPPSRPPPRVDPPFRPLTPIAHGFPPPPTTPLSLPLLSSLHVPLLSEPPRAFMGRGTPPDRRRLVEWSGSGRFATNGMGPPLYLSPVPQRHDVGIVPMSVDPPPPHPSHTQGEWTSFLYSMLEGDGVVGTGVGNVSHPSESPWYELGLGSVPTVVPDPALELPHPHRQPVDQPVEDSNSSSTLRFALG